MSTNEELEEHAHHAKEPFDRKVAVTMAIIAAALATVSVGGAYLFQRGIAVAAAGLRSVGLLSGEIGPPLCLRHRPRHAESHAIAEVSEKYAKNAERYEKEGEEIQTEARSWKKKAS